MRTEESQSSPRRDTAVAETPAEDDGQFRRLIDELEVGVLVQGARAQVLFANPAALRLLGLTEEQILGRTSLDASDLAVHEDGTRFPGEEHPGPQAIATGRPVRNVIMGFDRPAQKDRVWLLVNADPGVEADGTVHQLTCTLTDVTLLKQAEQRLRESEARYRHLVEKAQDIIYRTDVEGRFAYVNPAASRAMGYPESELVGKHFTELIRPDHRDRVLAFLTDQLRQRIPTTYDEFVAVAKGGHEVWIGQNVQILTEGDRVTGFQAVARDITRSRGEAAPGATRRGDTAPTALASSKAARRAPAAAVGVARLLVAEDNPVNRKVIVTMLENLGYQVDAVANGLDAVDFCSRQAYDAILMDCQMPEMDGFTATAWIRQREGSTRRTPIIALTASVLPGDREKCFAAGMDDYLAKPVGHAGLAKALHKWIGGATPAPRAAQGAVEVAASSPLPSDHPLRVLESQGRSGIVKEVIDLFLQTTPLRLEALRQVRRDADVDSLLAVAHSLKGAAVQIGARAMADVCAQVQAAARSGQSAAVDGLLDRLEADYQTVRVMLEAERSRLAGSQGS